MLLQQKKIDHINDQGVNAINNFTRSFYKNFRQFLLCDFGAVTACRIVISF